MSHRALLSWFTATSPHGAVATPAIASPGSLRAWEPPAWGFNALRWMLLLLLVAYWAVLLRPPALGGETMYVFVRGTSMVPTYDAGDLVVIRKQDGYEVGDVVTYRPDGSNAHVIHRVVAIEGDRYILRGDNRSSNDPWEPTSAEIDGRPMFAVPRIGLWMVAIAASPTITATVAGSVTFLVIALSGPRTGSRPARQLAGAGGPPAPPRAAGRGRRPHRHR